MKQKIGITIVFAVMAFVTVSCSALWRVDNSANISFSLSKEAITTMILDSNVRNIDSSNGAVLATISLYKESGSLIDSENVILEGDEDVSVKFTDLPIIGDNVYAKIEATIEGVKHEGISETKRMSLGENALHISGMKAVSREFTVTFEANNGTGEKNTQIFIEDIAQKLEKNSFSKAGETFIGWAIASGGGTDSVVYADEAEFTATKDVTLYAVWAKQYTLTFNANGGTVDPVSKIVLDGMPIGDLPEPTKTDSTFSGWQIDGASISSDAEYTYGEDKEAIAIWDVETYTVSFETNGGTELEEIKAIEGSKIAKPANPEKEDASFIAWYKDEALTTEWNFDTDVVTSDMTLYASWNETIYTITFDDGNTQYTQEFIEGVLQNLKPLEFAIPAGNAFLGWTTTKGGTTVEYTDEQEYTATEDVTMYAVWLINPTKVTATLSDNDTVLTVTPTTDNTGTSLKAAMHAAVDDSIRPNITKIVIEAPTDGSKIIPENDLSRLFYDDAGNNVGYTALTTITGLEHIYTSNVTNMSYMFAACAALTSLTLPESFNTSSVTNMSYMFGSCSTLTTLVFPDTFDTSSVTNMSYMFAHCSALTSLELPQSFDTSQVTDMLAMFAHCSALTSLELPQSFDTSAVEDMRYMFNYCTALTSLTLPDSFDTSKVTYVTFMFDNVTLETVTVGSQLTKAVSDQILPKTGTINGVYYEGMWVPEDSQSDAGTDILPLGVAGTYKAKKVHYTVTYELNGGSGSAPTQVDVAGGDTFTVANYSGTKEDHVFTGWNDGTNIYAVGSTYTMPAQNVTLTAVWREGIASATIGNVLKIAGGTYEYQGTDGGDLTPVPNTSVADFYLGETEVTQAQWEAVMTTWPGASESKEPSSQYGDEDNRPAYYISWYDAVEFCNALTRTELTEEDVVYYIDANANGTYEEGTDTVKVTTLGNTGDVVANPNAKGYRLPTEVEWEYAAGHGGFEEDGTTPKARTTYAGTNNDGNVEGTDDLGDYAWYSENTSETKDVGTKKSNALGLFDMSGNVFEWCYGWYAEGSTRVFRGGGWSDSSYYLRVASRINYAPSNRGSIGFRVGRSVAP